MPRGHPHWRLRSIAQVRRLRPSGRAGSEPPGPGADQRQLLVKSLRSSDRTVLTRPNVVTTLQRTIQHTSSPYFRGRIADPPNGDFLSFGPGCAWESEANCD